MSNIWDEILAAVDTTSPVTRAEVKAVFSGWGAIVPSDYIDLLARTNGCWIRLGEQRLRLYSLSEMRRFRSDYGFGQYFDEAVIFGSNAAGSVYCFDTTSSEPQIWETMFVPFSKEVVEDCGRSLANLISAMGGAPNAGEKVTVELGGSTREWHARAPLAHGGSPTEPGNWVEIDVPSPEHAEICRFWNDVWQSKQNR